MYLSSDVSTGFGNFFNITQNTFFNNTAQQGGAIYINDAVTMVLSENTVLQN